MSHLVFVDSNYAGLAALRRAKALGHEVTVVLQDQWQLYPRNEETERTFAAVDRALWAPTTTDASILRDVIARIRAERPVDAALTTLEYCVEPLAEVCRDLGLRYTPHPAVRLARNKHLCRDHLDRHGIPSARHAFASTVEEAVAAFRRIGAPAVVKPSSGCDSILAAIADDEAQVRAAAGRIVEGAPRLAGPLREQFSRGILVEEKLRGELVSVEIGMSGGEPLHYAISQRFRAQDDEVIELGSVLPARLGPGDADAARAYAVRVCRALGLDLGIFHLEMIMTASGPRLVEVNPRLMGGGLPILYERFTGESIHDHLIGIHLGTPRPVPALPAGRFASTHSLCAHQDGTVPAQLDLSWVREFDPHVVYLDASKLVAARTVRAGEKLARFQLVHSSYEALEAMARAVQARFAASLGIELKTW